MSAGIGAATGASPTLPLVLEREAWTRRWARRLVSFAVPPLVVVVLVAALPLLLPATLAFDLVGRRRLATTRLVAMGIAWGACESFGLIASGALWLGAFGRVSSPRSQRAHFRLQVVWARALFACATRIFAFRISVRHRDAPTPGPLLVFVRHVSPLDTLLPAVFLSATHGLRLRYALKRELLVDPCLDVVGQRMPNVFLARGTGRGDREAATLAALARGLDPDEGILIYPEGTRFSPERRARALERVAESRPERLARVEAMAHVLPPRSGGPLALFDAAPDSDLLMVAHHGFDGLRSLKDVLSGALVGRRIEVESWRIPASARPTGDDAQRLAWLDERWAELDAWVAARATGTNDGSASLPPA